MNYATLHTTNTPRRTHPAVLRAALRSHDRLIQQTDGNGNTTQFQYGDVTSGLNGLLTRILYPTLSQDLQYDQRNRITRSTDASTGTAQAGAALALDGSPSQTTQHQYDWAGHLTTEIDPAGRSTHTQYNAFGEITQSTDAAGASTQYSYDTRGNLITVTDAKGNIHRYDYDKLDRLNNRVTIGDRPRFPVNDE